MVDYRNFRFHKLGTPEFSHLKLLLFWPIYGVAFFLLERGLPWILDLFGKQITYYPVWCPLDDVIPFCELFIIPYYFWFAFLAGMLLYSLLFEVPTFRKYMWFIIWTYSITCVIYAVFPNMQELRPEVEEIGRQNFLVDIAFFLYNFDTNTNVFPSLHVIGSFAVFFAAWHSERFSTWWWRLIFGVCAVLISISTVFLRQHSILDVVGGLVVCFAVYPFVFLRKPKGHKGKKSDADSGTEPKPQEEPEEITV